MLEDLPKNIIKSELKRRGLRVKDLILRLKDYNENISELSFNNKISRGAFSAVFFLKCMKALGVKNINLED